jgi:endonuclease YncB( thermonuclease family)
MLPRLAGWLLRTIAALFAITAVAIGACAQDADTIKLDGTSYRLDGVDAPEPDQNCLDAEGQLYPCGRSAIEALNKFVGSHRIYCEDLGPDQGRYKKGRKENRFGRCSADGTDLSRWLVQNGWAINFEPYAKGRFKPDEDEAGEGRFGIWKGCFAAPQDLRRANKRTAKLLGPTCPADAREKLFPDHAEMPPGCEIKGTYAKRATLQGYRGIYHLASCGSYRRMKKVPRWFCSEEDAIAAGFRKVYTCGWW